MTTVTKFSHVRPNDTPYREEGLRSFFEYRDLGVASATSGKVIVHLVRAKNAPVEGTGWHIHEADFQIVIMLKGWARFMYEDKETLVSAGDCVHQSPGIRHFLFDYFSPATGAWTEEPPLIFGQTITVEPLRHCTWNAFTAL